MKSRCIGRSCCSHLVSSCIYFLLLYWSLSRLVLVLVDNYKAVALECVADCLVKVREGL